MKTYTVDLGDSKKGPFGMVLRVRAVNEDQAVEIARQVVGQCLGECDQITIQVPDEFKDQVEYIRIYVNPDNITVHDIYSIDGTLAD